METCPRAEGPGDVWDGESLEAALSKAREKIPLQKPDARTGVPHNAENVSREVEMN